MHPVLLRALNLASIAIGLIGGLALMAGLLWALIAAPLPAVLLTVFGCAGAAVFLVIDGRKLDDEPEVDRCDPLG
jgi:hypothetical protein